MALHIENRHKKLVVEIAYHPRTWWWRLLIKARFWEFFMPFPLLDVLAIIPVLKKYFPKPWIKSSGWMTLAIVIWYMITFVVPANVSRDEKIAQDAAKILFQGAFLLGTILSVSVALPGQAIIKSVITDEPDAAIDFVVPFMWALMFGISGGVVLTFYAGIGHVGLSCGGRWEKVFLSAINFVGIYGALMELNALGYVIRTYVIGIILWSHEQSKK